MSKHFKIWFLALLVAFSFHEQAFAQFRGFDRGGDSDRSRWGGDRGRGGDSRWGGDRGRGGDSRWGGGFPGGDFRGFDRGRGGDDDNDRDRGGDRGRGDDRSRGDRSRGDSRGRDNTPRIQPFVPKPHSPIGMEMPGNYVAGDADGDGQIDLLEWRQWKPQEISNFMTLDTNKDGFLTARELVFAEENPSEAPASNGATYQASTSNPAPSAPASEANGNASGEKPSAAEARWVFGQLDKNRSGQIEDNEWQGSKTIRTQFQDKGINLTLPVDQATFLDRYPPERIVPQVRLPG